MANLCNKSNHVPLSLISKGILGGATGLLTRGMLHDFIEIIVTTKKGRKGGSGAGAIDKDYWKRFQREVEEDGDEIDVILVKIIKKHLPKRYKISMELIRPQIEMELLEMQLYKDGNKPTIDIELIETSAITNKSKPSKPSITTTLINEDNIDEKSDIKMELIDESEEMDKANIKMKLMDEVNEEIDKTDIKIKLIKESFIYKNKKP
tara:strand:+ start:1396 stop:2016 length:621 start_codon:yes stop_codon:yes gene_type:complete